MADLLIITPSGSLTGDKTFAGAKATFFDAGTTAPATVYSDSALTIPHPSPLVAGADGLWPEIFVSGASFKAVVVYSDDTTCYTLDPCPKSQALGSAASSISFAPTVEVPYSNVQDAIAAIGEAGGVESAPTFHTASGTYSWPAGVKWARVRIVGGGGGGGGADGQGTGSAGAAGGGAAGDVVEKWFENPEGGYTVVIGAGGAGGAAGDNAGAAGGDSTFTFGGVTVTAGGGGGGGGRTATSATTASLRGVGGSPSVASANGDFVFQGFNGSDGYGAASGVFSLGHGANGYFGRGGRGGAVSATGFSDGSNAAGYGAGGGGGAVQNVTNNVAGGSGAQGLCIVEVYQ